MMAHRVFCVSVVCSAVVITPANTGPMNFLKVMVGDKRTNNSGGGTTRPKSVSEAVAIFAATAAVSPYGDVGARVATDVVPSKRLSLPAGVNDRVAAGRGDHHRTVDRVDNNDSLKDEKNNRDTDNNAVIQRLCSAVLYAATMPQQHRGRVDDATAGSVGGTHQPPSQAPSMAAQPAQREHHSARKSFRKRFPPAGYGTGPHEWFGASARPADRYRDPILAQETSRGVDYLTSYPLAKGGADEEEKYYEDAERPAEVWKVKVVGEPMAKSSSKNSGGAAAAEDDDDDDDEMAAANESH